jgi:hypothetical protein
LYVSDAHSSVWKNTEVSYMQNVYVGRKNIEVPQYVGL